MAKEVLKITAMESGNKITATINDVNPEATNAQLATLGTMFTALTTNTYDSSDRVTTVNVDTEPGGGIAKMPALTLSVNTITKAQAVAAMNGRYSVTKITTNSDGQIYVRNDPFYGTIAGYMNYCVAIENDQNAVYLYFNESQLTVPVTLKVGVLATANFQGTEVDFTVTA